MQGFTFDLKAIHIVRVDPGEDILESLSSFCREAGIRQAVIMSGYGTLAAHSLHWVAHNRIPSENRFGKGEGGIEILSMNGLVVRGEAHIHVSLATEQGAYGGHMEPGCIAYVLCEVFIAEISGDELCRDQIPVDIAGMGKGMISRLAIHIDRAAGTTAAYRRRRPA